MKRLLYSFVLAWVFATCFASPSRADWYGGGTNFGSDFQAAAVAAFHSAYPVDPGPSQFGPFYYDVHGYPSLYRACEQVGISLHCAYGTADCPRGQQTLISGCSGVLVYQGRQCDSTVNTGSRNNAVGDPCDVTSGNNHQSATDFETTGTDRLSFRRSYDSNLDYLSLQSSLSSRLGIGWRSEFDATFHTNGSSPTEIDVILPSGAPYHFTYFSSHWFLAYWSTSFAGWWPFDPRHDSNAKIAQSGSNWIVTDDNDVQYTFDSSGNLTTITYRDGYMQTLTYTSGHNTSVTDSFGRQLTFTYVGDLLDTMTDPDGNVYHYTYTSKLRGSSLQTVVYPANTPSPSPVVTYLYEDTSTINQSSLTGIIDENGNRFATWAYDSKGRVTLEEFAGGANHIAISYDDTHTQRTVTNGLGKQFLYSLSTIEGRYQTDSIAGQASTNTAASTISYTHDSNGFLTAMTDGQGNITHYTNNSIGQETSRTEGYGTSVARTINTTWDTTYHVIIEIQQPGLTTDYGYTSGRLTSVTQTDTTTMTIPYSTNGQTRTWTYTYATAGLVRTIDGPLSGTGDTVTYTYNTDGSLASFTDQVGHTTTVTSVNGRGEPLSTTDPNGVITNYTYDKLGRLLTTNLDPSGIASTTTFTYDLAGNVSSIVGPDGSTLNYVYDNAHRLTQVSNGSGEKILYTLNAMGGRTEVDVNTSGGTLTKTETAAFDELNRLMTAIGAGSQTTAFTYDKNNNNVSITDPRSKLYSNTFDALNRLQQQTDPNTFNTGLAYNGKDEITAVTDARSNATSYVRDGFGDAIQTTSPDTGITVNYFDAAGRVTKSTDARGIETDFTYDYANRVLTKTFPASSGENVTYSYDATAGGNLGIGRLTGLSDGSGSTAYTYGALGVANQDSRVIGSNTYTTAYTFDNAGHVLTMTYPSGRIVTITRDTSGRISGITTKETSGSSAVTLVSGVTYKPFGPISSLSFGNGVALTLSWDQDYRLTAINAVVGSTAIQDLAYGYDAAGNILSITDNVTPGRSQSFTYDNLNRLVTASGLYGGLTFAYDGVGNRTTRVGPGGTDIYAYPSTSNRLSSITTGRNVRSFTYLNNGAISEDVRDASNDYTYTFNNAARLTTAQLNSSTVGSYVYNAFDQRAAKTAGGSTEQFVYDRAGHLIEEADASTGAPIREYIWLGDTPVALVDHSGTSPVLYYIQADHLNRPQKITDGSASIVWDGVFDPFGNAASVTGSVTNPLRFPGQYQDTETGLAQNWFRDYDSSIGRFAESDPLGLVGGTNTYGYANGNPMYVSDPSGRCPWCVFILLGLIAGGIDLDIQLYLHNGDIACVNWTEVGVNVAIGSLTGPLTDCLILGEGGFAISEAALEGGSAAAGGTALTGAAEAGGAATSAGAGAAAAENEALTGTALARRLGVEGEQAVGITGPKTAIRIPGSDQIRIPDAIDFEAKTLSEVKNVASQSYTRQLGDFSTYSQLKGFTFDLYVRPSTQLSSSLQNAIIRGEINLRYIPGVK